MAAASTKKLETLLECPICLEKVTDPRLFECLHFYCDPCASGMKLKTENNVTGYECPTCRKITPPEKLRAMHFMHELLEIVEMANLEQKRVCDMCKEATAEHKCLDCKQMFCSNCKIQHNRIAMLQNHRWEALEEGTVAVLDKHVHCEKHPQELVKIHCKDCKTLICLICSCTDHKLHSAETIEEALQHTLAVVKKNQGDLEKKIKLNEDVLAGATTDVKHAEEQYDEIEKKIEQKCEEVIRKARDESEQLKKRVAKTKSAHIDEIQQFIKTTDLTLKSQKNILSLSKTTLATAQSTSLLQTLQSGVTQSLASNLDDRQAHPKYQRDVDVELRSSPVEHANLLGTIVKRERATDVPNPRSTNRVLAEVVRLKPKLLKETTPTFPCVRFTKIDKELYCHAAHSNLITVCDEEFDKIRDFKLQNIVGIRDVTHVDPFLLIASKTGLYHSRRDGSNLQKITMGYMTSICWRGDVGYALDDATDTVITVTLNNTTQTFQTTKKIKIDPYENNRENALQITGEFIWISFYTKNVIRKYDRYGTSLLSFDSINSPLGILKTPSLCGQDAAGWLLIADVGNHRLVTLSPDGEWQRLQLSGLHYPSCARIDGSYLYVREAFTSKLKKFTLD